MAIGVGKSKYTPPIKGHKFRCADCKHFKRPTFCDEETVNEDAKAGKIARMNGKAIVQSEGCCNEYTPR